MLDSKKPTFHTAGRMNKKKHFSSVSRATLGQGAAQISGTARTMRPFLASHILFILHLTQRLGPSPSHSSAHVNHLHGHEQ